MQSYRETVWSKRLQPLAIALRDEAMRLVDTMTDQEIEQLRRDCEKPNKENCSFVIHQATKLLDDAVNMVQHKRRKMIKEGA